MCMVSDSVVVINDRLLKMMGSCAVVSDLHLRETTLPQLSLAFFMA